MNQKNYESLRSEKRHELKGSQRPKVKVRRGSDLESSENQPELTDARIVDISLSGIRLEAAHGFEFQEQIVLEIERKSDKPPIKVAAEVRSVQPADSGKKWYAGCLIADEFPLDYIDEIAVGGLLNRRKSERQKISHGATGRWELSQNDFPVTLLDVSANGVQLFAPESKGVGKRIRISFENQDDSSEHFTAKSAWERKVEDGYLIGCEVTEGSPYSLLGMSIASDQQEVFNGRHYQTLAFGGMALLLVILLRQLFY